MISNKKVDRRTLPWATGDLICDEEDDDDNNDKGAAEDGEVC